MAHDFPDTESPPSRPRGRASASRLERAVEGTILASRWLLAPLYLALAALLVLFALKAVQEIAHLYAIVFAASETELVLASLSVIDLVLIANLVVMVVISGYETFVSRLDALGDESRPSWLGKLDSSTIKVKLAASVVAVSSIHLLKVFINLERYSKSQLIAFAGIHLVFVVSALLLGILDRTVFAGKR